MCSTTEGECTRNSVTSFPEDASVGLLGRVLGDVGLFDNLLCHGRVELLVQSEMKRRGDQGPRLVLTTDRFLLFNARDRYFQIYEGTLSFLFPTCSFVMPLPNLRRIFSSLRTPEEEAQISRSAFFKFSGYILTCAFITWIAAKQGAQLRLGAPSPS